MPPDLAKLWPGLDHISNFLNSLDTEEMTTKDLRKAIYQECLQPDHLEDIKKLKAQHVEPIAYEVVMPPKHGEIRLTKTEHFIDATRVEYTMYLDPRIVYLPD